MAYTIFDKTYDDYVASHGGNWEDEGVAQQARNAAWAAYNRADTATRDSDWGQIYNIANDQIADQYENQNGQGLLRNENKQYKIEADKRKQDKDEGTYNADNGSSYHYVGNDLTDSEGNAVTDEGILNAYRIAKDNSQKAFGTPDQNKNMSNYDYYTAGHGINFQDVANKLDPQTYSNITQEGSGHVKDYHKQGINDLKLRYSPDVNPYTQQDANDLSNIISNDEITGWMNNYSKRDNNMTDEQGRKTSTQQFANDSLLKNNVILSDEFEKGNYSALSDLADGDVQTIGNFSNAIAGWGDGIINPADREFWGKYMKQNRKGPQVLLNESNEKINNYNNALNSNELNDEDKNEINKLLEQEKNNAGDLQSYINTAAQQLASAAILDSLGKQNNSYLNNASDAKGTAINNILHGNYGYNNKLFDYDAAKSDGLDITLAENPQIQKSDMGWLVGYQVPQLITSKGLDNERYNNTLRNGESLGWLPKEDVMRVLRNSGYNIAQKEK